ncbi:MAG: hypothetical protein NVSMB14_01750 [Isosphaeraceae bacterium]
MRELLREVIESLEQGRAPVVCQVVETKGSTPQKAGALMAVDPRGGQIGTLGGGCVEAEVKQKALARMGAGRSGTEVFTFVLDHDYAWADGLICGGKMVILAEVLEGENAVRYFRAYRDLEEAGEGFIEAIVVDPSRRNWPAEALGTRVLIGPFGEIVASRSQEESWAKSIASEAPSLESRPRAESKNGVAFLPTLPRIRLIVVGAGHVGQAVAELAARADFEVWVVDDRRQYANPERFPAADRLVVGPLDEVLPSLEINAQTYALIVTRGHGHDQEALYYLAPTRASYVGLIGSKRKIRLIFDGLRESGISSQALDRVKAPVGLDIASRTVFEIAVSIVAELIDRRNRPIRATRVPEESEPATCA